MPQIDHDGESFYLYAMQLFSKAGHVAAAEPEFANHFPEQFLSFDSHADISLSKEQRLMFNAFNNTSRLFTVNDCTFLSVNLLTTKSDRSQAAHDIHTMLHPFIGTNGSVCLFRYDEEVMLSFMGYGLQCILSDW